MRNFIILHGGRVGSSALIDTLMSNPAVNVPIFEELDLWWIQAHGLSKEITTANVHEHLDRLYLNRGPYGSAADNAIGFKWRPWGNASRIAEILLKNRVLVFNLTRADLFEYVSSLYVSHVMLCDKNDGQFDLKNADTDEKRDAITGRYRRARGAADIDIFEQLTKECLENEIKRMIFLEILELNQVPITTVFYEDFAYKRYNFMSKFARAIDVDLPQKIPKTSYLKVGLANPSEVFLNRSALLASKTVVEAVKFWDRFVYSKFSLLPAV